MNKKDANALFAEFAPTPAEHFRLHFLGTILGLINELSILFDSIQQTMERFPFLVSYNNEIAKYVGGLSSEKAIATWWSAVDAWEEKVSTHLPFRAVRQELGLEPAVVNSLMLLGLAEEDTNFGTVFELLQSTPGHKAPALSGLCRCMASQFAPGQVTAIVNRLRALGLVEVLNPEAPRQEWKLEVPPYVWDNFRGCDCLVLPAMFRFHPPSELLRIEQLILPEQVRSSFSNLSRLVHTGGRGEGNVVILRGPRHNGRHTLLGALARSMGRGLLEIRDTEKLTEDRWRLAETISVLLRAMPVVEFDLAPGQTMELPDTAAPRVPVGIIAGMQGGFGGRLCANAVCLAIPMPDVPTRNAHWQRCLEAREFEAVPDIAERSRISAGNVYSTARLARAQATLSGREIISMEDILSASRQLNRQHLDTLARHVHAGGNWNSLQIGGRTAADLQHLDRLCRHRERVPSLLGRDAATGNCGVRALFTGPSGTGKTLAARVLASSLQKDLYQLDLSAVVNKYIGETEKNLNRILERAEELDIVLLMDEGDALLTQRTDVHNSNDRFANLETNFLLQRLESFDGILIITTNGRGRIDPAFERRMDVVINFHAPDAEDRWNLWQTHLPAECHVDGHLLNEISSRCELNGGQIRNAVMHASLLAMDNGGIITSAYLEAAIRREYIKLGSACPLRNPAPAI